MPSLSSESRECECDRDVSVCCCLSTVCSLLSNYVICVFAVSVLAVSVLLLNRSVESVAACIQICMNSARVFDQTVAEIVLVALMLSVCVVVLVADVLVSSIGICHSESGHCGGQARVCIFRVRHREVSDDWRVAADAQLRIGTP